MNGTLEDKPVLEVQVENEAERGLLGVAILMMTYVIIKRKGLQIIKVNLEFFFILLEIIFSKLPSTVGYFPTRSAIPDKIL